MASLALQHIDKRYALGHAALRGIDLDVADGELLVLVGPSGCGKSTLLRVVAGLESPTGGRVLLDGTDVTRLAPQDRDLAMVFQSYALYPHMSVRENLAYGLRTRGMAKAEADARVVSVAGTLGLSELLARRPAQLSGGQRQRVALGRAMVRDPKAFLLDEPLSNLDPGLRARARLEVRHLHRTLGATILYVTHDQEEAMTLGSRVAVMREGRIEQVASPLELYERPATLFVARFVGSPEINVLDPPADGMTAPVDALAAVRPHDVVIGAGGPLRARVDAVEPRGPDAIVHLRADGGRALVAIVPAGAAGYPDPGSEVRLSWRPERVHYFDRATGARRQDV